jgi:hypothetical protein
MAERFPIESLKVVGNSVYHVAPDGQMFFVRSLGQDPRTSALDPTEGMDIFAATPPPAENIAGYYGTTPVSTFLDKMTEGRPSGPEPYFGQAAVGMATPYLENARDLALSANTMTPDKNSYVPESVQRMGHYAKNMGLAGLSAAMAPVYGAAGAVGDVAKAVGVPRSEALTRDLGAMLDTAGVLPEGRILGAMADAGAVGAVAAKAPALYADAIGNARALAQGDLEFMRGRGLPENAVGVGADVPKAPGIGDNGGPPIDIFEAPSSAPAPRQRYVDPTTGRYSKAFEAAHDLKQEVGTPQQMRAALINQGVPEEELLYTGFDNWLQGKDKVTKDEVINILGDIAINKSGQGSLPFKRVTHEGTGITGGGGGQQLQDLQDQILQDRRMTTARFVDDYAITLRQDLEGRGFQRITSVDYPEDLQNLFALIAEADSKGLYVDSYLRRRAENVQEYLNRGESFYSPSVRRSRMLLADATGDIFMAPDGGSLLSENTAFEHQFPDHELPSDMQQRMEYELQNSVEQMDGQQVADYLGLNVEDLLPTFDQGTTQYAEYGPKGLMDYRENRYGYDDAGRGVISGAESELGTRSYLERHFPRGSEDENRLYHARAGMLNTPEGKAYLAFELQSDIGQAYRTDPSRFHVTGSNPTFEIPKASKKALQEYASVGKKYQSLMDQEKAAMDVLYSDKYLDIDTGRLKKDVEGYEELSSHIRDLRAERDAMSNQLMDIERANNDVIDEMQRFYGRPGMSIRTADAYGQDFDAKSVEEALAGGLKPKYGSKYYPKGKTSTRPFTTSTNRWVPAALKDELFNAVNSDAEWFSLPLGKDVESWTYGESAGQADFYENIVPTQLRKLLKKEYGLDVPIEKIKAEGFLTRDNPTYEVNAIRLTPELKRMIKEQGFSTFKKGGPVEGSSLADVDVFALQ